MTTSIPTIGKKRTGKEVSRESRKLTRAEKGGRLAEARWQEIEKIRPWTYSVPSETGEGFYEVNLKFSTCSCPDRVPEHEHCKHVVAVLWLRAHTSECSLCHERYPNRELVEVQEDEAAWSYLAFENDLLCQGCRRRAGV